MPLWLLLHLFLKHRCIMLEIIQILDFFFFTFCGIQQWVLCEILTCLRLYKADTSLIPAVLLDPLHSECLAFHLSEGVSCQHLKFKFSTFQSLFNEHKTPCFLSIIMFPFLPISHFDTVNLWIKMVLSALKLWKVIRITYHLMYIKCTVQKKNRHEDMAHIPNSTVNSIYS